MSTTNLNVADAIAKAKALRPSEVSDETMVKWLSSLDGKLWLEVISQYENPYPNTIPVYTLDDIEEDVDRELLISAPYDQIYIDYLLMRIDLENDDYERYNNRAVLFNEQYQAYVNYYNREHIHSKRVTRPEEGRYATWLRL